MKGGLEDYNVTRIVPGIYLDVGWLGWVVLSVAGRWRGSGVWRRVYLGVSLAGIKRL